MASDDKIMLLTEIMDLLQTLNLKLQQKNKIISDLSECQMSFQILQMYIDKILCHVPQDKKNDSNIYE